MGDNSGENATPPARIRAPRGADHPAAPPLHCSGCAVRRLALFQAFPPELLGELTRLRREVRHAAAGVSVIGVDQPAHQVFTVYRGWAFSYRLTAEGRRQIVDFHLPGDLVGIELLGGQSSGTGIAALTSLSLCAFDAAELMQAAAAVPTLGAALAWMSAREEALLSDRLTSIGRRSAVERIGQLLLELWTRQRLREPAAPDCWFPLSNQHIADTLGLSAEHVSRSLGALRRMQLARLARDRLLLPAPRELAAMSDWTPDYLQPRPLI